MSDPTAAGTVRAAAAYLADAIQRMTETPGTAGLPPLVHVAFTPTGLEAAVRGTQRQRETAFDFLVAAFTAPAQGDGWECESFTSQYGERLALRFIRPDARPDARPSG